VNYDQTGVNRVTQHPLLVIGAVVLAVIALIVASVRSSKTELITSQASLVGSITGKTTDTGSIALQMTSDQNGNGSPNWGDVVRFTVSSSASHPWVNLNCSRDGTVIAVGWAGYFDGALGTGDFGLYSPQWVSGSADCVANLYSVLGAKKPLVTLPFLVAA